MWKKYRMRVNIKCNFIKMNHLFEINWEIFFSKGRILTVSGRMSKNLSDREMRTFLIKGVILWIMTVNNFKWWSSVQKSGKEELFYERTTLWSKWMKQVRPENCMSLKEQTAKCFICDVKFWAHWLLDGSGYLEKTSLTFGISYDFQCGEDFLSIKNIFKVQ